KKHGVFSRYSDPFRPTTQRPPKINARMHIADRISILVASDNHYSVLIGALIKSIDTHHKTGEAIDFYIIDDHISGSNKDKIVKTADPARINIRWIEISRLAPYISQLPLDKSSFPTKIYYRIFAPHLIDAAAKKLIYLDVDTIVRTDISNLWNVNLASHAVAAVQDIGKTVTRRWGGIPNYTELGLSPDTKYSNSGVLLIHVDKWRKQHISPAIVDVPVKYRGHAVLPEQYGLLVVFAHSGVGLAPAWNWSAAVDHDHPHLVDRLRMMPSFEACYSNERWKKEF